MAGMSRFRARARMRITIPSGCATRDSGSTVDLFASGFEWNGTGEVGFLGWLDNTTFLYGWHCGTACTSLNGFNIETHFHWSYCYDTIFHISPDKKYAVGESEEPYELGDKRGGLAVISLNPAAANRSADDSWNDSFQATILSYDRCAPGQTQKTHFAGFGKWSADSKSFTYTLFPCLRGGKHGSLEKRVFYVK